MCYPYTVNVQSNIDSTGVAVLVEVIFADGRPISLDVSKVGFVPGNYYPNTSLVCALTRTKVVRLGTSFRCAAPI